jgi:hypothetical protein
MATLRKGVMFALAFALHLTALTSLAGERVKAGPYQVEDLWSEDRQTRADAYTALRNQHREMIIALKNKVAEEKTAPMEIFAPPDLAAQLLGRFGSMGDGLRTSIPTLVAHVEYRAAALMSDELFLGGYPCAIALRDIGHTSVAYILSHLQVTPPEEVTDNAMELYAYIMIEIYGRDGLGECIAWVQARAERSAQSRGLANFARLLNYLEQYRDKLRPKPQKGT